MSYTKVFAEVKCFDSNVVHEVDVSVSMFEKNPKQFVLDAIIKDGEVVTMYGEKLMYRKFRDVESVIVTVKEEEV